MSKGIITHEQRQDQVISRLKNKIVFLQAELKKRDDQIVVLNEKLEKALLYIEELQKHVFRSKKKSDDEHIEDKQKEEGLSGSHKRNNSSYRRPLPQGEDITNEETRPIKNCSHCQTRLTKLKILEFYEEDILPMMDWFRVLKKIKRIKITTGYCSTCKKRVSAASIPKQKVSLGQHIRQLIVFQNTIEQFSYSQIRDFLRNCLHLEISEGEIVRILTEQAHVLKPAYEDLLKSIREDVAVHMDETGWKTVSPDILGGDFIWAMTGISKTDVVYAFGKNRGLGNAKALLGDDFHGVGITDDYNAYKNMFDKGKHALCWAHPDRKLRDLKNSDSLSEEKKENCKQVSEAFSKLYQEIRALSSSTFVKEEREKAKEVLMETFKKIMVPNKNDPSKLVSIKKRLLEQIECYFVCLTIPGIPSDNNKAERILRHLVIKRKKSFGSKTSKGAEVMSTLYSVVMSLWNRSKENFFRNYLEAVRGQ